MPNNATVKTKSVPKYWPVLVLAALVLLGVAGMLVQRFGAQDTQPEQAWPQSVILDAPGQQYELEVVSTTEAQARGLSGRPILPDAQGMLFAYSEEDVRCFWMKDMHFPIDIIWLDAGRQVVHIEPDVAPATYPDSFCADAGAQYIVELNAGEAVRAGIEPGQHLDF